MHLPVRGVSSPDRSCPVATAARATWRRIGLSRSQGRSDESAGIPSLIGNWRDGRGLVAERLAEAILMQSTRARFTEGMRPGSERVDAWRFLVAPADLNSHFRAQARAWSLTELMRGDDTRVTAGSPTTRLPRRHPRPQTFIRRLIRHCGRRRTPSGGYPATNGNAGTDDAQDGENACQEGGLDSDSARNDEHAELDLSSRRRPRFWESARARLIVRLPGRTSH